jgi:hypothetical protein
MKCESAATGSLPRRARRSFGPSCATTPMATSTLPSTPTFLFLPTAFSPSMFLPPLCSPLSPALAELCLINHFLLVPQWRDVTALGLTYAGPPKGQFTFTLEPRKPVPHAALRRVHILTLVVPTQHMYGTRQSLSHHSRVTDSLHHAPGICWRSKSRSTS